ncbi:hypothetical protein FACS1894200_14480 [Spirochaetia bacterium]|nr:hypothetical protein FACS1894200_14480 [Spirochaetia bacterium]
MEIDIVQSDECEDDNSVSDSELELDEQWSFVGNKGNQRWLW